MEPMKRSPPWLIAIGLLLGGAVWLSMPVFLPLLIMGESSSGKGAQALFYILSGPVLVLPWTILGIWRPVWSAVLFLLSALVNTVAVILWASPSGDHVPVRDEAGFLELFLFACVPGPVLLLLFASLFCFTRTRRRNPA